MTTPTADLADHIEDLAQWADAAVGFFPVHGEKFKEIAIALRSGLNPGMREALERIRDFPIGGHTAAGAMALIARQALGSPPPAEPDEPMFVILARDPSAPELVEQWAIRRVNLISEGKKPESDYALVEGARECADKMRQWRAAREIGNG